MGLVFRAMRYSQAGNLRQWEGDCFEVLNGRDVDSKRQLQLQLRKNYYGRRPIFFLDWTSHEAETDGGSVL